ncbi:MAG: histidine phosphatase family protein [Actinomycetota bacterium]|nr:histidine phosphatase family protein [Actinomycetota bacterium]
MDATIHLVRHGQVANPSNVIYGRLPGYNLSERGKKQAEAAAQRLADRDIGAIWASPLERAQETAAAIAAYHDVEVTTDERLTESATTLEGLGRSLIGVISSPRHWWSLRNPLRPSWGETFSEIRERTLSAVREAVEVASPQEVVIVSHQAPVLITRLALTRRRVPPWLGGVPCTTGSVTTLVLKDDKVVSAAYFEPAA